MIESKTGRGCSVLVDPAGLILVQVLSLGAPGYSLSRVQVMPVRKGPSPTGSSHVAQASTGSVRALHVKRLRGPDTFVNLPNRSLATALLPRQLGNHRTRSIPRIRCPVSKVMLSWRTQFNSRRRRSFPTSGNVSSLRRSLFLPRQMAVEC